jgi:hypothetical protein
VVVLLVDRRAGSSAALLKSDELGPALALFRHGCAQLKAVKTLASERHTCNDCF